MHLIGRIALISTTISLSAIAQNAGPATDTSQPRENPAQPGQPAGADVSRAYGQSGGSLLRAQLTARQQAPRGPGVASNEYNQASFFAVPPPEPRVIRKHDLITVIVRQQSEFKSDGSTDLKKDAVLQASLKEFINLNLRNLELTPSIGAIKPAIDLSGGQSFKGTGTVERSDEFTARMQGEVVDVKPNGNLVIQARSNTVTDDERQYFVVSGIIRAQDVSIDNTVLSSQMYDLDIKKTHEGTVREGTRRGWLPKLLDALRPF